MDLKIEPELERCLPPLPEIQYQKLKASIEKKYDPAKPIVLWLERPRTIVDGHHRYRACQETGQEPTTVEESFASLEDAVLYALQRQIEQRNLTSAQLILIQEQMMSIEEKKHLEAEAKEAHSSLPKDETGKFIPSSAPDADDGKMSREVAKKIAEKSGAPVREVYRVHKVQKTSDPALMKLVESGEVSSGYAERFADAIPSKEVQREVIISGGKEAVFDVARAARKEAEEERKARKEQEERQLEALRSTKTAIDKDVKEFNEYVRDTFGDADNICIRGAKVEMWCSDCKWGFDTYNPNTVQCCPYCSGKNIVKREPDWWPGKKVI